ncbi:MAG: hypothetical protein Q8903_09610 [Bacteroidota bacterium]|nr:hypothetical protein [Bacteroidota bacterium]
MAADDYQWWPEPAKQVCIWIDCPLWGNYLTQGNEDQKMANYKTKCKY